DDFEEMKRWVQDKKFDRLGVFTYSHEENTHAYQLKDNVPAKTKQKRAEAIMNIQNEISLNLNEKKIGKQFKVLIARVEGNYFVGRTEFDSPEVDNEVLIPKESNYLRLGDFVTAQITQAEAYDLYAIPCKV